MMIDTIHINTIRQVFGTIYKNGYINTSIIVSDR